MESALEKAIKPLIFEDFNDLILFALLFPFISYKTVHKVHVTYYYVYIFFLSPYTVRTKDKAVIAVVNKARHYIPGVLVLVQKREKKEKKAPKPFKIFKLKLQYIRRDIITLLSTLSYKMSNY
jgi:hypothetical protein